MPYVFIRPTLVNGINYATGSPADDLSPGQIDSLLRAQRIRSGEDPAEPVDEDEPGDEPGNELGDDVEDNENDGDVSTETDDQVDGDDAVLLKDLGVAKNFLNGFASAKIETLGQAREYFAKHGSFEPLPNIGSKSSPELVKLLGL